MDHLQESDNRHEQDGSEKNDCREGFHICSILFTPNGRGDEPLPVGVESSLVQPHQQRTALNF